MSIMKVIPFVQIIKQNGEALSAPSPIPFDDGDLVDHLVEHGVFFFVTDDQTRRPGRIDLAVYTTDPQGEVLARGLIQDGFSVIQIESVVHNLLTATHVALHPQHADEVPFSHDGKSA